MTETPTWPSFLLRTALRTGVLRRHAWVQAPLGDQGAKDSSRLPAQDRSRDPVDVFASASRAGEEEIPAIR